MKLTAHLPELPPFPRVLYVDDFHAVVDTAAILLSLLGFDVRAAYDGPAALLIAADFHPHVCFLDLNMPGMDGDELAVKLREQAGDRAMLLVCVTAMSGDATGARLTDAGFHFHLLKPADPASVLAVLRGGLGM